MLMKTAVVESYEEIVDEALIDVDLSLQQQPQLLTSLGLMMDDFLGDSVELDATDFVSGRY